jgi:uncharacterized membrane protein
MNNQPNRGPMPFRFMIGAVLAALTCFVTAVVMWSDHNGLAVTFAIAGLALLVGNYLVKSRMWRDGMLPIKRH